MTPCILMQGMQFTEPSSMKVTLAGLVPVLAGELGSSSAFVQLPSRSKETIRISSDFISSPSSFFVIWQYGQYMSICQDGDPILDFSVEYWQNSQITKEGRFHE